QAGRGPDRGGEGPDDQADRQEGRRRQGGAEGAVRAAGAGGEGQGGGGKGAGTPAAAVDEGTGRFERAHAAAAAAAGAGERTVAIQGKPVTAVTAVDRPTGARHTPRPLTSGMSGAVQARSGRSQWQAGGPGGPAGRSEERTAKGDRP